MRSPSGFQAFTEVRAPILTLPNLAFAKSCVQAARKVMSATAKSQAAVGFSDGRIPEFNASLKSLLGVAYLNHRVDGELMVGHELGRCF